MSVFRLLLTAVLTVTLAAPAAAFNTPIGAGGPKLTPAFAVKQQRASNAAEAARIAKQRYGGKILKVDAVRTGDGVLYRVKILLDNGRVKTVTIAG